MTKVTCYAVDCPLHPERASDKCSLADITIKPLTIPSENGSDEVILGFVCALGTESYYGERLNDEEDDSEESI